MPVPGPPRVLIWSAQPKLDDHLCAVLGQIGEVVQQPLGTGVSEWPSTNFHLIVIDAGLDVMTVLDCSRRLQTAPLAYPPPLLVLLNDPNPATRAACLQAGATAYVLRPFAATELLAQAQHCLQLRQLQSQLADQTAEVQQLHQRLKQAYQQIDVELEAARRLQRSFLPSSLPQVGAMRFAVYYRPCDRVGGDFYDVFRLDEEHIGFYVADVMGHGIPASLLTIFLKRGVRPKDIHDRQYRLVCPAEVLARLNQDLLDQHLPDLPFISMVYVLLNCQEGTLHCARAGHPYPLYLPTEGEPQFWSGGGGLLGIFPGDFPVQSHQLRPGDKLLLYTDGLDLDSSDTFGETAQRLRAAATSLRKLPLAALIPRLVRELLSQGSPADDFTLLGVERVADER